MMLPGRPQGRFGAVCRQGPALRKVSSVGTVADLFIKVRRQCNVATSGHSCASRGHFASDDSYDGIIVSTVR